MPLVGHTDRCGTGASPRARADSSRSISRLDGRTRVIRSKAVDFVGGWLCRAGTERAIELLGGPSWLCARCTGFYLAIACGGFLVGVAPRLRRSVVPRIALAMAIAMTLLQVASESIADIGSSALLRLVLGAAVGLPLGWVAASRLPAQLLLPFGRAAALVLAAVVVAAIFATTELLAIATCGAAVLALAFVAVLVSRIVLDPSQENPR